VEARRPRPAHRRLRRSRVRVGGTGIASAEMMFRQLGWEEATLVGISEFGRATVARV